MSLMTKNALYFGCFVIVSLSSFNTVNQVYLALVSSYSAVKRNSFEATSIPGINNEVQCQQSGRNWQNNQCWDKEHNPMF